jgi:hypothetical protein
MFLSNEEEGNQGLPLNNLLWLFSQHLTLTDQLLPSCKVCVWSKLSLIAQKTVILGLRKAKSKDMIV